MNLGDKHTNAYKYIHIEDVYTTFAHATAATTCNKQNASHIALDCGMKCLYIHTKCMRVYEFCLHIYVNNLCV